MEKIKQAEYDMLREASWKRMEAQRTLSFFVVTATLTVLGIGFALDEPNKYIFILPVIILFPSAAKVYQCKKAISCLGGYMIVFLESDNNSYQWETDSYLFKSYGKDIQNKKIISIIADMEFCLLGVISTIIYFVYWCLESNGLKQMLTDWFDLLILILALIAICIIFYITKQFSLFNSTIRKYIKEWNRYAFENKRIEEQDYKNNIKKLNLE